VLVLMGWDSWWGMTPRIASVSTSSCPAE